MSYNSVNIQNIKKEAFPNKQPLRKEIIRLIGIWKSRAA